MKETELRKELKETIKDTINLTKLIRGNLEAIDRFGRELLEELQMIRGWKTMLVCRPEVFDSSECVVDYDISSQSIIFKQDGETFLTIRLDIGLIEQVVQANRLYGEGEEKENVRRFEDRGQYISVEWP